MHVCGASCAGIKSAKTDAECLEQANSLIMLLKADVRALNVCAARFLPPPKADHATADFSTSTSTSEVAVRYQKYYVLQYGVVKVPRLFNK